MTSRTPPLRRLRFILNTFYSGPQAWFFLADDLGFFRDEGLEIEFTEGDTLANAVPRIASGEFDCGYGDINALIELAAVSAAGEVPLRAVYATFSASPYTLAVPAAGPIRTPLDLAGTLIGSHPSDAAWRLWPEFVAHTGVDTGLIRIEESSLPHAKMIVQMLDASRWQAMFGFVNTLKAAAIEAGRDPDRELRFLEYRDVVPDLYGAALMVSATLLRDEPQLVAGLTRAVNRGVAQLLGGAVGLDAVPGAALAAASDKVLASALDKAIDAVARRNPAIDRTANRARLAGTLALEMAHPDAMRHGIGDLDDGRLQRSIDLIVRAKHHPRVPAVTEVFDRRFLPPLADRPRPRTQIPGGSLAR